MFGHNRDTEHLKSTFSLCSATLVLVLAIIYFMNKCMLHAQVRYSAQVVN